MANYDTKGFFVQCAACAVTVSQTKMGACLQFEWSDAKVQCCQVPGAQNSQVLT